MKYITFFMKIILLEIISTVFQLAKNRVQTKKSCDMFKVVLSLELYMLKKCAHWLVESKIDESTPEFRRVHLKNIL